MQNFVVAEKKAKDSRNYMGAEILNLKNATFDFDALNASPWYVASQKDGMTVLIQPETTSIEHRPRTLVVLSKKNIDEFKPSTNISAEQILSVFKSAGGVEFNDDNVTNARVDIVEVM